MSAFVALAPYYDLGPLYDQAVSDPTAPWANARNAPWWSSVQELLNCPSDVGDVAPSGAGGQRGTYSYGFCGGDSYIRGIWDAAERTPGVPFVYAQPNRGIFGRNAVSRVRDIIDGTSNTIAMSERSRPAHRFDRGNVANVGSDISSFSPAVCAALWGGQAYVPSASMFTQDTSPGYRWADGAAFFHGVTTILPPNSAVCLIGTPAWQSGGGHYAPGIWTPTSEHAGGVFCLMADGSVRFVSDNIDAGNTAIIAPADTDGGASPYGVWGALGTKFGSEVVGEF